MIMASQGVNEKTLSKVKNSNGNYDVYRHLHGEMMKHIGKGRQKQEEQPQVQVVEHKQTITMVANHYMMEQLQKQTELLTLIGNKLAVIIDDLYGTKGENCK